MIHTAILIFHDYRYPILRNSSPPVSLRREYFQVRILKNEKIKVLLMKLLCILIYDRSVERLWTAKKNLCILK